MEDAVLKKITVGGFKSIHDVELELRQLNVLIGANGAGKSNLVAFFRFLEAMGSDRLEQHVATLGGATAILFYGGYHGMPLNVGFTARLSERTFEYAAKLIPAQNDSLIYQHENVRIYTDGGAEEGIVIRGPNRYKSGLVQFAPQDHPQTAELAEAVKRFQAFHFHDTSNRAAVRLPQYMHDNDQLRHDAANLAAMLYRYRETNPVVFRKVIETFRQIAPWFAEFELEPLKLYPDKVMLNWRENRFPDALLAPHQMSDGTLRALALVTLLLQPAEEMPALVVIDEPELGLHPHAIVIVAALIKAAAHHCQIILATQSPFFLDQFDPQDVIVVERERADSVFRRPPPEQLREWLEDYTLSELWEKNVIGGGPL